MTTAQLLAAHLKHDLGMMNWHLADFTDADMFHRPCPAGNHAMWQTGHILGSTGRLLAMIDPSFQTPISEELTGKFTKETSTSNDAKMFPTLAQLREALIAGLAAQSVLERCHAGLYHSSLLRAKRGKEICQKSRSV